MSRFRLHTIAKEKEWLRYLAAMAVCVTVLGIAGYAIHSVGTARAKSRETVMIYTEEEFATCLLEKESGEYNLNGRYRLGDDLDLSWLEQSIGTNIEPFTGMFDGDGHKISGLTRPLFGAIEKAEIENLFFSEVYMTVPFTYSNGERYVDGYGALAAYALDSRIQNCGMSGEIHTASPSEAEYQLEKASPADADEEKGPGMEGDIQEPAESGEILEEPSTTAGPANDIEETSPESRPGTENDGTMEGESNGTAGEPTNEGSEETSNGAAGESSNGTTGESPKETAGESSKGAADESSKEPAGEPTKGEADESSKEAAGEPTKGEAGEPTKEAAGEPTKGEAGEPTKEPAGEPTKGEAGEPTKEPAGEPTKEAAGETSNEMTGELSKGTTGESSNRTTAETVGYQLNARQYLMMKAPTVIDPNPDQVLTASPSEATPPDAKETTAGSGWKEGNRNAEIGEATPPEAEPLIEYIGNPDGDIYILVTAERVTAGGLVAETAGETLISESFAMVTIDSRLEDTETRAGGIAGMIGNETRVENSYTTGLVDCDDMSGGFAAVNEGVIENCYSTMTLGESGEMRGAFTAWGNGTVSGCIYDRQMACIDEEEMEDQSGFCTLDMTGLEARIPGNWYLAEHAYPQLEYFALSEDETIRNNSRASAVALILPNGTRLSDVLKDGEVILPNEVDGQEIKWDAEGGVWIDEKNQLRYEEQAEMRPHEAPAVGVSLKPETQEESEPTADSTGAATTESLSDTTPDTSTDGKNNTGIRLKVSVGDVSRSYALAAVEPKKIYSSWWDVGIEITEAPPVANPDEPAGTKTNPYLLDSAEDLAWFGVQVNTVSVEICATMTADINLFGEAYTDAVYDPGDLSNGLEWRSINKSVIGDFENGFRGVFDGGNHKIQCLVLKNTQSNGLFGAISHEGIVKNVGIESGYADAKTGRTFGMICGILSGGKILNCWNAVTINNGGGEIGGIAGYISGYKDKLIEGCYNFGDIKQTVPASAYSNEGCAGIVGQIWTPGASAVIRNCYNFGNISSASNHRIGGIVGNQSPNIDIGSDIIPKIENCYNAGAIQSTQGYAIMGGAALKSERVINCYYDKDKSISQDSKATALSTSQLASWAAPYALNGQSRTQVSDSGLTWVYDPAKGYPCLANAELAKPDSWLDIGQGVADGLIKTNTSISGTGDVAAPYQIKNGEELAWFAANVNTGGTSVHARLENDINLTGTRYGGTVSDPIPWYPIGTAGHIYQGTFDGNGKAVGYLNVNRDGYAGLFGCAGIGAKITGLGLDSTCRVTSTGTTSGNGTAGLVAAVKSDGSATAQITIQNCYSRATVKGASGNTGAFVGGFEGTAGKGAQKISNCYTAGPITSTSGTPGAIAGAFTNEGGGGIQYCYWDSNTSQAASAAVGSGSSASVADSGPKTTEQMKSDDAAAGILNGLNTNLNTGTWERTDSRNDGYPIFQKATGAIDWEIVGASTMPPSCRNQASVSTAGTADNPYLLWTPEDLAWFANQVNHKSGNTGLCAEVMADIRLFGGLYTGFAYDPSAADLMTKTLRWIPIGEDSAGYTGTFNGNGHTITVMKTEGTGRQGLFGTVGSNAVIKNVALSGGQLGEGPYAGGIAGYIDGADVTILSCGNTGKLEGAADYVGGIVGGAGNAAGLVIEGCYNHVDGTVSSPGRSNIGGILGGALSGSGAITVRNCYNRGNVSGWRNVGGIAGSMVLDTQKIVGCYSTGTVNGSGAADTIRSIAGASANGGLAYCFYDNGKAADGNAKGVRTAGFGTWGAAYALNGEKLDQATGLSWTYTDGEGCPSYGMLESAKSWEVIGEAVDDGFFGAPPSGSPYQIDQAEQLAWFAGQINNGSIGTASGACLTGDIDLSGTGYVRSGRLSWIPIGKDDAHAYRGIFRSDPAGGKIYQIQNLYVNVTTRAGLFGIVESNAEISEIGIVNADIFSNMAGGIVGLLRGNAVVSRSYIAGGSTVRATVTGSADRYIYAGGIVGGTAGTPVIKQCYNSGGNTVTADGPDSRAGGIAGVVTGGGGKAGPLIEDCYHLDSTVTCTGTASAYAGGITSFIQTGEVRNSYNACGTAGSISSSYGLEGGIVGEQFSRTLTECYSEELLGVDEANGVRKLGTENDLERQSDVDSLNTTASGERKGAARVWFTSLKEEETRGLPTLAAPVMLEASFLPADSAAGRTVLLDQTISGATFRGIHQEHGVSQALSLTADVGNSFQTYGSENANQNLGFGAGGKDLGGTLASLTEPSASLGDVSALTLYNGAAYTCPDTRAILVDFASGTTRYEVRAVVEGVTGRTLSVILPTKVTMNISPDGTARTSHSANLKLVNENDYPMEGSIKNLEFITGEGYVKLQPVKKDVDWTGKKGQITELGVKLGIDNLRSGTESGTVLTPSAVYYTPKEEGGTEDSWMNYRLKSRGTLSYQYFMQYAADPYYNGDLKNYGYTVAYRFGVAAKDYTSASQAEIVP